MSAQLALQNGVQKGAHFLLVAGRLQFDAAVPEVSDKAGYIEPLCNISD